MNLLLPISLLFPYHPYMPARCSFVGMGYGYSLCGRVRQGEKDRVEERTKTWKEN